MILGAPPERTFFAWKAGRAKRIPEDTLRRIGYVAGIYKALQIVYSDAALADGWPKRPNASRRADAAGAHVRGRRDRPRRGARYVDAARAPWS